MKAVILAGGRGSRMGNLTIHRPKPLIEVQRKPLLVYTLDALPVSIEECILVIGYRGEEIRSQIGLSYQGLPITYAWQTLPGTGGALLAARQLIEKEDYFLTVGADDIFGIGELEKLIGRTAAYGIAYCTSDTTSESIVFNGNRRLIGRVHITPGHPRYIGVGAYLLPPTVFDTPFCILRNGEYSIPHSLATCAFEVYVSHITRCLQINTPDDVVAA